MNDSFFLSTSDAADRLGVAHTQLNGRSSIPYTFHLMVNARERVARLWPREYIDAFAVCTRHENHYSISRTAMAFATRRDVPQLYENIQQLFAKRLGAREVFTGTEVAEVFCVAPSTVAAWRAAKVLVPLEDRPPSRGGRGRPVEYVFSQAELRRISKWHLPKV